MQRTQPLGFGGRIVLPTDSGLAIYDLSERAQTALVRTPAGELVTSAAWSPDGSSVAYGRFHRPPGDPASASEIYLVAVNGGEPRPLAERDRPGAVLDMPVWSSDGGQVYFSYFGQVAGRPVQRIERVTVESRQRETMVDDGYSPAITPDGQSLLFLRDSRAGTALLLQPLSGGDPRTVLAPNRYPTVAVPRVSPDGQRVVLSIMNTLGAQQRGPGLLEWLLGPTAYAHGQPWDIWTFDLQGNDPRRLTNVNADDPSAAWSPDGRHLAFWGGGGLYVVPSEGGEVRQVLDRGGYGPIDWRP